MKTLSFVKANRLGKLHTELLAAVPALRPRPGAGGFDYAVFTLSGRGDDIELIVPDDADEGAIQAVITAHDPTSLPPTADETELEEIKDALRGGGNLTAAQVKKALRFLFKQVGFERKV